MASLVAMDGYLRGLGPVYTGTEAQLREFAARWREDAERMRRDEQMPACRASLEFAEEFLRAADEARLNGGHLPSVDPVAPSRSDVDYSAIPVGDSPGGSAGPVDVREGMPLRSDQSVVSWVRARGQAEPVDDNVRLGAILRSLVTGERRGLSDGERRALDSGVDSAGGYLIPEVLAARMIDLARNKTRVLQAGAQIVPMEASRVAVPRLTEDVVPQWREPNDDIVEDEIAFGLTHLTARGLGVLVKAPRELLQDAPNVEDIIWLSFAEAFAHQLDYAALRGAGSNAEPTGVRNDPDITVTEIGSGNGDTIDWDDLVDEVGALDDLNEEPTAMIWTPRTKRSMAKLKDSQLRYLEPPTAIRDLSKLDTNQIPIDLTVGTSDDCTEIYTGDWRQLFVGVRTELFIEVLRERHADKYQYGFLAHLRADTAVMRTNAVRVLTGVRS